MRHLLDTDVLSQLIKAPGHPGVLSWIAQQVESDLLISAVSIFEIRNGIELLPQGKRRVAFDHWLTSEIRPRFAGRIVAVDEEIADVAGRITASQRGVHPTTTDVLIAATAKVHGLQVATLNRKHFERLGVELVKF